MKKPSPALRFCAVKKWKDGGETVVEYFATKEEALAFIRSMCRTKSGEFTWCVGELD